MVCASQSCAEDAQRLQIALASKLWRFLFVETNCDKNGIYIVSSQNVSFVVVVVVVWGPESGCTAACRLIVHTPCAFSVPTFTARKLHVTTTLEILAAKSVTFWARNFR
jgi:hypothetical protein